MSRISRLSSLNPLAISITWGAGGSTKDRSLELAGLTQAEGLSTILHLTCTNMEQGLVDDVLQVHVASFFLLVFFVQYYFKKAAKKQGIQNILALRGGQSLYIIDRTCPLSCLKDPPRGKEEWIPSDPRFTRATDLVSYIRSVPDYSSWFCIGVAGNRFPLKTIIIHLLSLAQAYPDGHAGTSVDEDIDIDRLKIKVDAGADFIITQLFYDVDHFLPWYRKVRQKGEWKIHACFSRD